MKKEKVQAKDKAAPANIENKKVPAKKEMDEVPEQYLEDPTAVEEPKKETAPLVPVIPGFSRMEKETLGSGMS